MMNGLRNRKPTRETVPTLSRSTDQETDTEPTKATDAAAGKAEIGDGNELVAAFSLARILMPLALIAFMACAVVFLALIQRDVTAFIETLSTRGRGRPLKVVQREIRL